MSVQFQAAALWWANRLRTKPVQDVGGPLGFREAAMNSLMTLGSARFPPLTEEQVSEFATRLAAIIEREVGPPERSGHAWVSVDYDPSENLAQAAEGLFDLGHTGMLRLPIKTNMLVERGTTKVSAGYAQPYETIWPPKFPGAPSGQGGSNNG